MGNVTTKSHYSKSLTSGSNSRRPRWEGPGLPAAPGKPILIPGADDTQPEVVAIRWERSPSNGGSAIVGYLVEHRRQGSAYWVRSSSTLCTFPELTLSDLEPGWRYQFRVRAQNALGLSLPSEISDPLTVTLQRAAASAPHFDLELKDTVVLESEQAEFVVRYTGTPLPKISWFKDGFEIFSSRRTRIITENGRSILLIHQTALNDEGEIKCTATNRAGHIGTKARLILEAPPKIRLPRQYEDGLLFEQDETIRLKVSLAGRPAPTVTWYHDGELISKNERHVFEMMDGESILKIPDAKRNDRGEYTVKVSNKLGEDASSFLVTVTDRPAAPGKATVTMTLGRSVTLSWKEPEDDGGCKIGTYIVEYYRIGWDVWLKATTSRQTTATMAELIEGSEYKFRVKAENPYGVSDPSEESDVIFIPDLKRGLVTPVLSGKSQSHREISRSRGAKREVSFAMPAQRTRSLTREEARSRDDENEERLGPVERSVSAQRLAERPSRADSRVTFALETLVHDETSQAPVSPARSRDHIPMKHDNHLANHIEPTSVDIETTKQTQERTTSPKPVTTVTISPPPMEESAAQYTQRDVRSRSVSVSRERSLSPLSMSRTQEPISGAQHRRPPMNLKKQNAVVDEPPISPKMNIFEETLGSPTMPREDDENAMRGSSEFMLVLYPEDPGQTEKLVEADNERTRTDSAVRLSTAEEEEEDLIPPPISLSLPELFSAEHQIVETIREAVSSTELLHERAMERFYKAVAAEEASDMAKRKVQLERQTGELASTGNEETGTLRLSAETDPDVDFQDTRMSSLRRRLSNSGVTSQNLISSWQAKKSRRRSSTGQAEGTQITPIKLLSPSLLPDVEARSDPNLPRELETPRDNWRRTNEEEAVVCLRRWHENTVPLVEQNVVEKSIPWKTNDEISTLEKAEILKSDFTEQRKNKEEREEEEESMDTSIESSEEISSADSEDLKLLKSRILAREFDQEETYHPRGKPTLHVETESPETSADAVPIFEISPLVPARSPTPVSPSNIVPKSILKKPREEPVPLNSFGRPIPPEKPVRKVPPQPIQNRENESIAETMTRRSMIDSSEVTKAPAISESDADSILSAAEAAKSRRIQARNRSMTPDKEVEQADMEARMAVVNHYTEIVREHSIQPSYKVQNDRRLYEYSTESRRSSISGDNEEKYRREEPIITKVQEKLESQQQSKATVKNERHEKNEGSDSRRNSVSSRGTTPLRDSKTIKDKRASKTLSRNESPAPRSRNVSVERDTSSKLAAKNKVQERGSQPPSRPGSEERSRLVREKSVGEVVSRTKPYSRTPSRDRQRSSSRDRQRAVTPVETRMERLQNALERKKYRSGRRESSEFERNLREKATVEEPSSRQLAIEAKKNVRSTMSYVTDLTLLIAAIYVYLFKKETLAIPFIALLLYRRIQEEVHGRASRGWSWFRSKR
ncbi:hypothetical protein KM043_013075 [Ampulex compressa]|nr:hypothetical protein KM043_013075 [Ampulex compressa]